MDINFQQYEYFTFALNANGKTVEIPLRRGQKDAAFIDALTFTIHKQTIDNIKGICGSDKEYVAAYSEILCEIFGFGVTEKRDGKGRYFYQSFYRLGSEKVEYGTLHIGGQNDTILIELTGTACQAAKSEWEARLYTFLKQAKRPQITRIDCAHDFFNGEYSPEKALIDHNNGLFNRGNKRPKSECKGTAWREEDYTGKTFYVGRRGSSKLVRVYEKGRQLGDADSAWTRFEIEFRSKDCLIPLEILINPGEFLTGAYPVGEILFKSPANRIEATTQKVNITFDSRLAHGKNQVGRLLRFLKDLGWDAEQIVSALIADEGKYPKGLNPMEYDCTSENVGYIDSDSEAEIAVGITPDELDEVVRIDTHIRAFNEDISNPTNLQKQLIADFPADLKRFMTMWQTKEYYAHSKRSLDDFRQEQQNQRALNEHLDYLYLKYGTLFPTSKTSLRRKQYEF